MWGPGVRQYIITQDAAILYCRVRAHPVQVRILSDTDRHSPDKLN